VPVPNARALHVAQDLALPLDAVTEVLAFVGRRGQGKSYAAQLLAEQMHAAEAQFVVLDPVGVWWGLRLAANGKDPGIPIPVLGGLHGDVPLEPTAGKLVADLVVDRGISAVLDVSQFESDAAKARFAAEWGARFFYRKKAAPSAVHVFVEEAQEFVPQNPQRDEAVMLHHFQRLAKLGRNFGVGLSLITQRPQEVHKKVLNLTELLFAFQLTGTHERRAVADWIEDKSIDEDVASSGRSTSRSCGTTWRRRSSARKPRTRRCCARVSRSSSATRGSGATRRRIRRRGRPRINAAARTR
jgi:DNA helicase HerA-like ATPase